jgi:hypothetical protein
MKENSDDEAIVGTLRGIAANTASCQTFCGSEQKEKAPTFEAGAFSIRTSSCVVRGGGIVEGRSWAGRWFPTLARFVSAGSEPKVTEGA